MSKGSNDIVSDMGCPRCIGTSRAREILNDNIDIIRLHINQVISQSGLGLNTETSIWKETDEGNRVYCDV